GPLHCLSTPPLTPPCATPFLFLFNATPTTAIYTLSLHDALPISRGVQSRHHCRVLVERLRAIRLRPPGRRVAAHRDQVLHAVGRSEEHTSELQSPYDLVCRLLLEKKKKKIITQQIEKYTQIKNIY